MDILLRICWDSEEPTPPDVVSRCDVRTFDPVTAASGTAPAKPGPGERSAAAPVQMSLFDSAPA